jgi:ABC-type nitrate/sulfonate/bicarbonate transport system substrate-binding protein
MVDLARQGVFMAQPFAAGLSRRQLLRAAGYLALAAPAGLALAACGKDSASEAGGKPGIDLISDLPTDPSFTADFDAQKALQDEGTALKVDEVTGANTGIDIILAGKADIATSSLVAGLLATQKNQKVVAVFPSLMVPYHVVVVNADKIKSWDDFANSTIGATSKTDSSYWEVQLLAQKHNVPQDAIKSMKLVAVKGSAARTDALLSGKIDGGLVSVANAVKLLEDPRFANLGLPGLELPDLLYNCYWVTDDYKKANGDKLTAYAKAMMEGHRAALDEASYTKLSKSYLGDAFTASQYKQAYDLLIKMKAWDPNLARWSTDSAKFTTAALTEVGILKSDVDPSQWMTTEFVDAARKQLGAV